MKKSIIASLLGGLLLCGSWAAAQPKDPPPAPPPTGESGVVQVQIGPAAGNESGAIAFSGTVPAPAGVPAPRSGTVMGGGFAAEAGQPFHTGGGIAIGAAGRPALSPDAQKRMLMRPLIEGV